MKVAIGPMGAETPKPIIIPLINNEFVKSILIPFN
jgi:hypothetical protein